jgi:hypothetical protein
LVLGASIRQHGYTMDWKWRSDIFEEVHFSKWSDSKVVEGIFPFAAWKNRRQGVANP